MIIRQVALIIASILSYILSQGKSRNTEYSSSDFLNKKASRTINLSNRIIEYETKINIVSQRIDPIFVYRFPILKNNSLSLVNLKAVLMSHDGKEEVTGIKINKLNRLSTETYDVYEINFRNEPMNNEEERILIISEHYFGKLQMLPKKIAIKDDQLVLFEDTQNLFSLYNTLEQELEVKLPHDKTKVISYSEENAIKSKDKIIYSINSPVEPLRAISFKIHYENNSPLMVFNYGYKSFEVSHWGNVAVEERYQIENIGAKLDGEFGRVDFDERGKNGGKNAFKRLNAKLPLRSNGLWYRDEIGNISTSRASRTVITFLI